MLATMEKSWLGKLFSSAKETPLPAVVPDVNSTDPEVLFNRGLNFATGAGVAQDYAQALDCYHQAAEQNHGLAQFNLGMMYARGQGVARNDVESAAWFGRAARLGDAGGQYHMGRNCQRASMDGLPADAPEARIEAYKWFQLSAAQGYKDSEGAFAPLTFKMTRAEVADATHRVSEFVPTGALKPVPN